MIFTEAHDYIAAMNDNRSRVPSMIHPDDPESLWARKRALLGAAVVFTPPGIPMLFQGQELHETLPFHDDTPLRWERLDSHAGIVQVYRDLIRLRRNLDGVTPGLRGVGVRVIHLDNPLNLIAYVRWHADRPDDPVLVVANFSAVDYDTEACPVPFPSPGAWYCHFNSDSSRYAPDFRDLGADRVEAVGEPPGAALRIGRYSLQIFSKNLRIVQKNNCRLLLTK